MAPERSLELKKGGGKPRPIIGRAVDDGIKIKSSEKTRQKKPTTHMTDSFKKWHRTKSQHR